MEKNRLEIYTDGSVTPPKYKGEKTPGGWGVVVVWNDESVAEFSGNNPKTTISEMEVQALTFILEDLTKKPLLFENYFVYLYSDSNYCVRAYNEWIDGWAAKGWTNSQGKEVAQKEYWQKVIEYKKILNNNIEVIHVNSHSDNKWNNYVDNLCNSERRKIKI